MRSRLLLALMLIPLLSAPALKGQGGAWPRNPGSWYSKFAFTSATAADEFGYDGEPRPLYTDTLRLQNASFGISTISWYGEIGITPWLTGTLSTWYTVAVREGDNVETGLRRTESASGLGDTWIAARIGRTSLIEGVAGAVSLAWKIPSGSPSKEIALGSGSPDYEVGAAFGRGFVIGRDRNAYGQLYGGYRFRSGFYDDRLIRAEGGADLAHTLSARLTLDGRFTGADFSRMANERPTEAAERLVGNQSELKLAATVEYVLWENADLSVGLAETVWGRNALDASAFTIGIAWHR